MKLETKFDVGQRVIHIYVRNGEIHLFEGIIEDIWYGSIGLVYYLKDIGCDIKESELIDYNDKEGLFKKIEEGLSEIKKSEEGD